MRMRDIKPVHIRGVMSNLAGYSRSVQGKAVQILRSIFNAAVENHLIMRSPVSSALKAGGETAKEKVPLTPEQSQRLLDATAGTRAYPAVAIMLGAGLRKEEAIGLMWEDVDLESGYIHVRHAKAFCHGRGQVADQLKSKAAYRDIPLPVWLTQILSDERAKSKSPFVLAMRNGESLSASATTGSGALSKLAQQLTRAYSASLRRPDIPTRFMLWTSTCTHICYTTPALRAGSRPGLT